jgi:SWI/SNF-related matrix-associated actin-dependent regulator of chromatin subfamily A member 5
VLRADIDAILTKGERDTKALNDKMQQFTDNARKFTMDGGIENVYEYKDDEEEEVRERGGEAA